MGRPRGGVHGAGTLTGRTAVEDSERVRRQSAGLRGEWERVARQSAGKQANTERARQRAAKARGKSQKSSSRVAQYESAGGPRPRAA